MEAFLISTGIVTLAEIGDKTQLLALLLAARFRQPIPIVTGILIATLANHALAGALGALVSSWLTPQTLKWVLGVSFLLMAGWTLVPDGSPDDEASRYTRFGVFSATLLAFFLAEMGDKTQITTVALAIRFQSMLAVVVGTTLGMMLANVPVVLAGERLARRLPVTLVQRCAAALFLVLGITSLSGAADGLLG